VALEAMRGWTSSVWPPVDAAQAPRRRHPEEYSHWSERTATLTSEPVKYGKVRQEARQTPAAGDRTRVDGCKLLELKQVQRPLWIRRVLAGGNRRCGGC
jgi:hypothetical protein